MGSGATASRNMGATEEGKNPHLNVPYPVEGEVMIPCPGSLTTSPAFWKPVQARLGYREVLGPLPRPQPGAESIRKTVGHIEKMAGPGQGTQGGPAASHTKRGVPGSSKA